MSHIENPNQYEGTDAQRIQQAVAAVANILLIGHNGATGDGVKILGTRTFA